MVSEITNKDLYELIQGLINKTDSIQKQNDDIKTQLTNEIRTIKSDISEELDEMRHANTELKKENKILKERLVGIEKKVKKYNLIFYGIEEQESKINEIETFLDLINTHLNVKCEFGDIRDIYRFGKINQAKPRPMSVEFVNYNLKLEVLKQSKNLKGTGIFLSKDYTTEEYERRKTLHHHLITARDNNHQAKIKQNCLYVNGQKFTYEDLKEKHFSLEDVETEGEEESEGREKGRKRNEEIAVASGDNTNSKKDHSFSFLQQATRKRKHISNNENQTKRSTRQQLNKKN